MVLAGAYCDIPLSASLCASALNLLLPLFLPRRGAGGPSRPLRGPGPCYPPRTVLISFLLYRQGARTQAGTSESAVSTQSLQFERQDPSGFGQPGPAGDSGQGDAGPVAGVTFWRVEGSLLDLSAVRPVAYFTWNAQSFLQRWTRRWGLAALALIRPLLYAGNRIFATRVLHTLLRGVSRDRLDLLGEEYFHYVLKPRLKPEGVRKLKECMTGRGQVVLVSQGLDHVMRPLANYLGVERLVRSEERR